MQRLITILLAIFLACANASGQGKVMFGNDTAHLFNWYDGEPLSISPLPDGKTLMAVLYAGTNFSNLSLQTSVILDSAGMLSPGRIVNKTVVLTNIPGGAVAYFKIFIVDTGATLTSPIDGTAGPSGYTHFGTSGSFTATPGSGLSFPSLVSGGTSASTWIGPIGLSLPPFYYLYFTVNPSNAVVGLGNNVTLNALATGNPPYISYQWRKHSVPITGATNNYLNLTNVTLGDAGNYDLLANNNAYPGPVLSAVATVTVLVPALLGSPTYTSNNQFQFTVTGAPGTNYVVQVSTNLSTPDWLSIFTNTAPFTFVDSNATSSPQRFYRAYSP